MDVEATFVGLTGTCDSSAHVLNTNDSSTYTYSSNKRNYIDESRIKELIQEEKMMFMKSTWKIPIKLGSPIIKKRKKIRLTIRNQLN